MKMKKALALVLSIVTVFSAVLTGCGSKETADTTADVATEVATEAVAEEAAQEVVEPVVEETVEPVVEQMLQKINAIVGIFACNQVCFPEHFERIKQGHDGNGVGCTLQVWKCDVQKCLPFVGSIHLGCFIDAFRNRG